MSPNIAKGWNRKQKREFNQMSPEKKGEVIQAAVVQKLAPVMGQEIAKAMITGMKLEREDVYQKFVKNIDDYYNANEMGERELEIEKLLSYFRMAHLDAEKEKMQNEAEKK